jgi:hypothetical protein
VERQDDAAGRAAVTRVGELADRRGFGVALAVTRVGELD